MEYWKFRKYSKYCKYVTNSKNTNSPGELSKVSFWPAYFPHSRRNLGCVFFFISDLESQMNVFDSFCSRSTKKIISKSTQ